MPQIFHRRTNTLAKLSIFGAVFIIVAITIVVGNVIRSPYLPEVGVVREQPIPFSHDHHVSGIGIDCRYCHTSVETGPFAGIPSTKTCMNCHSQVWADSPMLEPVRSSFREDRPIEWTRVNDLPDFVYFDHSIRRATEPSKKCRSCCEPTPSSWSGVWSVTVILKSKSARKRFRETASIRQAN
jgi:hypothetical protein